MRKADEIKVVKADIRRLKSKRGYLAKALRAATTELQKKHPGKKEIAEWAFHDYMKGFDVAIATLEKYLKKIARK